MRDIKFRAWIPDEDEHGKMFMLPFSDGEHIDGLNENGTIEICRYDDYIVKVAGLDDENISEGFQPCEAIIMQFTGLKDKKGKELYQGDIITESVGLYKWIYEIKTVEGFGNNLYKVTRYRNFQIKDDDEEIFGDFWVDEGRSEIRGTETHIGNIYENPELLRS